MSLFATTRFFRPHARRKVRPPFLNTNPFSDSLIGQNMKAAFKIELHAPGNDSLYGRFIVMADDMYGAIRDEGVIEIEGIRRNKEYFYASGIRKSSLGSVSSFIKQQVRDHGLEEVVSITRVDELFAAQKKAPNSAEPRRSGHG